MNQLTSQSEKLFIFELGTDEKARPKNQLNYDARCTHKNQNELPQSHCVCSAAFSQNGLAFWCFGKCEMLAGLSVTSRLK